MKEQIIQVLPQLDIENENHWTTDGQPRVETVEALTGLKLTRADIKNAAPMFTRTNPSTETLPVDLGNSDIIESEGVVEHIEPASVEPTTGTEDSPTLQEADALVEQAREKVETAQQYLKEVMEWRDQIAIINSPEPETLAQTVKAFQASQQKQTEMQLGALNAMFQNVPDDLKNMLLDK